MKDFTELREHERTDFDTPVLFSGEGAARFHRARMQNFSDEGLYVTSPEYLRPGSTVCVKTEHYRSANTYRVCWCARLSDRESEAFGIGLQCEV
ncbi:hypothetical protein JCM14469_36430 [Desulfatiferula olefinivorans]